MKLLLVGDFGVGKTSILFRYMDNTYAENDKLSIGLEFKIKYCMFEGKLIKTMIWDTTGGERFRTITSSFYRSSHGILLLYDISDRYTFESIKKKWILEV